jgi:hypothetical protein
MLNLPTPGAGAADRPGFELYPFDMEGRSFPGADPFGPPPEPPAAREEEDPDEPGKFAVDEVPFFEVVEFELEEGD